MLTLITSSFFIANISSPFFFLTCATKFFILFSISKFISVYFHCDIGIWHLNLRLDRTIGIMRCVCIQSVLIMVSGIDDEEIDLLCSMKFASVMVAG